MDMGKWDLARSMDQGKLLSPKKKKMSLRRRSLLGGGMTLWRCSAPPSKQYIGGRGRKKIAEARSLVRWSRRHSDYRRPPRCGRSYR